MQIVKSIKDIKPTTYDHMRAFLKDKKQDISPYTYRTYRSKLKVFADSGFCTNDIDELDAGILRMFFDHYAETHQPSTVFSVYNVLKIFFTWYENWIDGWDNNPFRRLKPPRVPKKILDPVTLDDLERILTYCNIRFQAIFMFLYDSGARSHEALSLDISDVNLFTGQILIRHAKGNKQRYVYIGSKTRKILKKYLNERKCKTEALFATTKGSRLSYSALDAQLKRVCKKAGIPPKTLHGFRRGFALEMLRSGEADIVTISQILGHSSLATISRYAKIDETDKMIAHKRASPVDRGL
jgi:integrase